MRERIIFAPGLNGSELMRTLALHGINTINYRIMGASELAKLALMKAGISLQENFLSFREECTLLAQDIPEESYFGKTTFSDIQKIAEAVHTLRSLCGKGEEQQLLKEALEKGIFTEKNQALFEVYQRYMQLLQDTDSIDGIGLLRKAITESRPLSAEMIRLKEFPLTPLEEVLLEAVSDGCYSFLSISELFGFEKKELQIESYKNCYGAANEVETIISEVYKEKQLDTCTVAVTDVRTYGQLFFDYSLQYNLPITFGCGIPIINSNPARLLVMYSNWSGKDFYSGAALLRMLSDASFNRKKLEEVLPEIPEDFSHRIYTELLQGLRLSNNLQENRERIAALKKVLAREEDHVDRTDETALREVKRRKLCLPRLEILSEELALTEEDFIAKYAYIRKGQASHGDRLLMQLDLAAAAAIFNELRLVRDADLSQTAEDVIANVLKLSVCRQLSEAGKLHVTGISGALGAIRKHLFIAGLSASKYPGRPTENYLLLDDDLQQFGEKAAALSSAGRILQKKESLNNLLQLSSDMGNSISLSYSGMNVAELKKDNASSVLFDLFRRQKKTNVSIKELEEEISKVAYFAPALSADREIGKAYNQGKKILMDTEVKEEAAAFNAWTGQEWFPSAINIYLSCPRRFFLKYVLGIPEPEDEKPFEIISALATGTMAHALMEELANESIEREHFLQMASDAFDSFIAINPPLIASNIQPAKEEFVEMMATAYDQDPHREVILKEEDIHCTHESGVKIHGLPDRVERLEDGSCLIVDFKTSRSVSHEEDDLLSCLQVVIYAYLLEQQGYQVSGGEFRYIRLGETVSCKYDDEIKAELTELLLGFKKAFEDFSFPMALAQEETKDNCKYCKYTDVCHQEEKGED